VFNTGGRCEEPFSKFPDSARTGRVKSAMWQSPTYSWGIAMKDCWNLGIKSALEFTLLLYTGRGTKTVAMSYKMNLANHPERSEIRSYRAQSQGGKSIDSIVVSFDYGVRFTPPPLRTTDTRPRSYSYCTVNDE
jgi:hypothetical protein